VRHGPVVAFPWRHGRTLGIRDISQAKALLLQLLGFALLTEKDLLLLRRKNAFDIINERVRNFREFVSVNGE
jgi:hypothetical protein